MRERLAKKRMLRATYKNRRQEIEQCLAAYGLMPDLGRFTRRPSGRRLQETHSHRLRKALESLGPVFSAFGLYLSSRVDLLPVSVCLDLARIVGQVESTPISTVRALIAQEFACLPEEVYADFEDIPFESRLMFQSHRAVLKNGTGVTVKVIHSEWQEQYELDMELLPLLKEAVSSEVWGSIPIENAIDDFRHTLQETIDLIKEVKAIEELAEDASRFELLRIPLVMKDHCSANVITIERFRGRSLQDIMALLDSRESGEHVTRGTTSENLGFDLNDLAKRLCLVWLRQALLGSWFPVDLYPENIVVLPNKQIAFTGGEFARLPSDTKKNLWHYLIATSTEDPEKACSCLLGEMMPEGRAFDEEELRHRFREIVPFRDGGWSTDGESRSLEEHLFVHWKIVSGRGLRPQRHLLAFYRGLFQTAAHGQRLAPYSDSLLAGLQEVRTIEMLAQFRDVLGLSPLSDNLDRYTVMMMGLPQQLDEALTLVAESSARLKLQGTGAAGHHRQKNSSAVMIALLLVLAAFVILSYHLTLSGVAGAWFERVSAIVFVLLGALLLRAASHGR